MNALRRLRNALLVLVMFGLAALTYLGNHYIGSRSTAADAKHLVPFAAHGDYVFITRIENAAYYLLWAATVVVGMLCGWVDVIHDVRTGKIERPDPAIVWLVTAFFASGCMINIYWAFAS
jgi:hypothetical protein